VAEPNGYDVNSSIGESYVVFGNANGFTSPLNLSALDGTNNFVINGIDVNDRSGSSVSSAGDVNGDGVDDVIIGASAANNYQESSHIVFDNATGFSSSLNVSDLNGTNGFVINSININDNLGTSISNAGDVNGDGVDDVIIGATGADPNGNNYAGKSYVVFGKANGFSSSLNLSALDGTNGFVINGIDAYDGSGRSVSSAGDVNGDGVDDVIIGAPSAQPNGNYGAGESYVVFGKATGFSSSLNLSDLDGTNNFVINSIANSHKSGISVSSAENFNKDGYDDVIIVAPGANNYKGESYVVFGKATGFSSSLNLSDLNGTNGFVINGIDLTRKIGHSVSSAGDFNGDGYGDVIIAGHTENFSESTGENYIVFGKASGFTSPLELSALDGTNGLVIQTGSLNYYSTRQSVDSAGDINQDGIDDVIIGLADGNSYAGESYVVFGSESNSAPTDIALDNNTLDENQPAGTEVGTLTTVDPNTGDTHTYQLVTGAGDTDNGLFQIVGNKLQTAGELDFETKQTYSIRIQTNDGNGGTFSEQFTINVNDVKTDPSDIILSNIQVVDDIASGTKVGDLSAIDVEDPGDTHTYQLVAGEGDTDNAFFQIVGNELQTAQALLDVATQSTYSIRIQVNDGNGGTYEEVFTIKALGTLEASTTTKLSGQYVNLILTGTSNINGTGNSKDNEITGNTGNNVLQGASGNDSIVGNAGRDNLIGGIGSDSLEGGSGDDTYNVDNPGDVVTEAAAEGTDRVVSRITYTLTDNVENLKLNLSQPINGTGNSLNNNMMGNNKVNTLTGLAGNDTLQGQGGNDTLVGGTGDDLYYVESTNDVISEDPNSGNDEVRSWANQYTLPDNAENLKLMGYNNSNGTGNNLANSLTGNDDENTLTGLGGNDILDGQEGADTLVGGSGSDFYYVDDPEDVITEAPNEGFDRVYSEAESYTLPENVENTTIRGDNNGEITGNALANNILGDGSDNTITALEGNDVLNGATGEDTLVGGSGNDTYYVDNADDVVVEAANEGTDLIFSNLNNNTLPDNVERLTLQGNGNINGTGNEQDNLITGNSGDNILKGGSGADDFYFLSSSHGVDTLLDFSGTGGEQDQIYVSRNGFGGGLVANTSLNSDQFVLGTAATEATHRFIYDNSTGNLFYDADGSGAGVAVQLAALTGTPALEAGDIWTF